MEIVAKLNNARTSALKARLIADQIRGMHVERALNTLRFMPQKCGLLIKKVLESAIANAEHNFGSDIDTLKISSIYIDEAAPYKRMMARAKGRGNRILKRNCHITVKVSDISK